MEKGWWVKLELVGDEYGECGVRESRWREKGRCRAGTRYLWRARSVL